jgi:hypothetical protein
MAPDRSRGPRFRRCTQQIIETLIAGSNVTTIISSSIIITIAQPVIFSPQRGEFRLLFRAEGNRLGINA